MNQNWSLLHICESNSSFNSYMKAFKLQFTANNISLSRQSITFILCESQNIALSGVLDVEHRFLSTRTAISLISKGSCRYIIQQLLHIDAIILISYGLTSINQLNQLHTFLIQNKFVHKLSLPCVTSNKHCKSADCSTKYLVYCAIAACC